MRFVSFLLITLTILSVFSAFTSSLKVLALIRDLAITNVVLSTNRIYQGLPVSITITAKNLGNVSESFDVKAYYDSNVIGTIGVVNLYPNAETDVTITWDTSGVQAGKYTIKGEVTHVPYEINTTNNVYIDGIVEILTSYTLTINTITGGTTNPTPGTYGYDLGSFASVTALPLENYMFSHWMLDGFNAGSANPVNVLMNNDHTLQAVFSLLPIPIKGGENAAIESNVFITNIVVTKNTLHFDASGPAGSTGWINVTFPIVNTTDIKVFINNVKLTPPPFPIITTNGTHYFIYFEFTLSTKSIAVLFSLEPPIADFTWSPLMPKANQPVTFDGSSSSADNASIVSYEWDFGNGAHSSGQIAIHSYTAAGFYTVTLNVTDSEGFWDIKQKQITVTSVPVGGYCIAIEGNTPAQSLTPYLALMTILTVVFTAIRRKTTRKTKSFLSNPN